MIQNFSLDISNGVEREGKGSLEKGRGSGTQFITFNLEIQQKRLASEGKSASLIKVDSGSYLQTGGKKTRVYKSGWGGHAGKKTRGRVLMRDRRDRQHINETSTNQKMGLERAQF